jgi:transglutaminase-like putative cysteine protease
LGIYDLAYAIERHLNQPSYNSKRSEASRPEERFQKAIEEIEEILEDPVAERETKARRIKVKRTEIEELDREIRKQFAETEKKLREAGLSDEILQRHYKFVKHYEDNLNELRTNLKTIEKTKGLAVEVEIEKAKRHLQRVKPRKKHIPLDPNKLPHRTPEVKRKEPRLKKEDFQRDFIKQKKVQRQNKPIVVTSIGSLKVILSENTEYQIQNLNSPNSVGAIHDLPLPPPNLQIAQASNQPTPDDLAESIEVQFTPEITAKAEELGNNPVKIYNWVRNNIEFVPTYGSIQGAHMTLLTKQGNAFDTASLLIALLRVSNIPARYVYGTIELPIDKVMNWVGGFTDQNSAVNFIAGGGIPGTALTSGGKITAVRIEHMWVEAFVPYGPYSGRPSRLTSLKTWIPLDPSFKQYKYTQGIDLQTSFPFDAQTLIDQLISTATVNQQEGYITNVNASLIQNALNEYQSGLEAYIQQNIPDPTLGKHFGVKEIAKQDIGILPATLPYKINIKGGKYSEIPEELRHKITFEILNEFSDAILNYPDRLPALAGKRITLSYEPATTGDQQVINSYGGIYNTPAYLINVRPIVKIDGVPRISGGVIGFGRSHTFNILFGSPSFGNESVTNEFVAGGHHSIILDISSFLASSAVTQRLNNLRQIIAEGTQFFDDNVIGEILNLNGLMYFSQLNFLNLLYSRPSKIAFLKHPSEAIVSLMVSAVYSWGLPFSVKASGMGIDVDRDIISPASLDGDPVKRTQFVLASGMRGSGLENVIFEQIYQLEAISAVKALQIANERGIPIYSINEGNLSYILGNLELSNEVKMDISNAVNTGKVVMVPKKNLQLKDWNGVGYIVIDPNTGAGAYMISGGLAGGATTGDYAKCASEFAQLVSATLSVRWWIEVIGFIGAAYDALTHEDADMRVPLLIMAGIGLGLGLLFLSMATGFVGLPFVIFFIGSAIASLLLLWLSNMVATGDESPYTLIDDCVSLIKKLFGSINPERWGVRYAFNCLQLR